MFNPLNFIRRIGAWFSTGLSNKAKIIIISVLFMFSLGTLYAAYKVNDYFENNPNACSTCHVHDKANKAWVTSEHSGINCHECHHSTKIDQMRQLYSFVVLGHNKVTPRHGEVIVPWKLCFSCHWERNEKYPTAADISRSRYHAKHVFIERIECTKCHGYRTHKFTLEERYCVTCHKDKEVREHMGPAEECGPMATLPCLNCHTDRTKDLKPGRKKCLFCHGTSESLRKELIADGTIDVKHFLPAPQLIKKSPKIQVADKLPMQFVCYECHNPHKKIKPDSTDCLTKCHSTVLSIGKHDLHVNTMNLKCLDCHKKHVWKVTEEQAKKDCVTCHDYKDPKSFLTQ